MKQVVYIYQYNEKVNGHSILDKRLSSALAVLLKNELIMIPHKKNDTDLKEIIRSRNFDNDNSIIILSHFNTFSLSVHFKKSKLVFINHDLPYFAYLLKKNISGLIKAIFSWLYIHYYWRYSDYNFFISKRELQKSGSPKEASGYISIGIKPGISIEKFIGLSNIILFTGNYQWSLKAASLQKVFSKPYTGSLQLTALDVDEKFKAITVASHADIVYCETIPQIDFIKIGIITDDFLSGFKLKALELISIGCCLASFSDISIEFEDISYANLFIRNIRSLNEVDAYYQSLQNDKQVIEKFTIFYNEVCSRFNWNKTAADIQKVLDNI